MFTRLDEIEAFEDERFNKTHPEFSKVRKKAKQETNPIICIIELIRVIIGNR